MTQEALRAEFDGLVRKGIFRPVIRRITRRDPEEVLQDAICQTFEMYRRYGMRGVRLDTGILVHSCAQRATDLGRQFVKHQGQRKRDVMDFRNYRDGKVEVLALDGLGDEEGDFQREGDTPVWVGAAVHLSLDPTDRLHSALDLGAWTSNLEPRDRHLIASRLAGMTLSEIAEEQHSSVSSIFSRLKTLGRELAERAQLDLNSGRTRRRRATTSRVPVAC
jgi:hypothetical protein